VRWDTSFPTPEWQWRLDSDQHSPGNNRVSYQLEDTTMELDARIELASAVYETAVLPLN
jgi:hypothetical protein